MTVLFIILGGAVGGVLGWFMDRKRQRVQAAADTKPGAACETST